MSPAWSKRRGPPRSRARQAAPLPVVGGASTNGGPLSRGVALPAAARL